MRAYDTCFLPNALATDRLLAVKEAELLKILSEFIAPRHGRCIDLSNKDKRFGKNSAERNK